MAENSGNQENHEIKSEKRINSKWTRYFKLNYSAEEVKPQFVEHNYTSKATSNPQPGWPWADDSSRKTCYSCDTEFTLFNRRHHCRWCGQVLCGTCTTQTRYLPSEHTSLVPAILSQPLPERAATPEYPILFRHGSSFHGAYLI